MTIYYVSPSGSDSNNGLGPDASHATNKPWLTLGKVLGAAGFASGDTCHVAPGTYREVITVAMTSAVAETTLAGDPWNAQGFKDGSGNLLSPGYVIHSGYTTNDTTAPSTSSLITLSGRDFLTFKNFLVICGNNNVGWLQASTTNSVNIKAEDCAVIATRPGASGSAITHIGLADIAANWTINRCRFWGFSQFGINITLPTGSTADYDSNFQITNCVFDGVTQCVRVTASGANPFKGGGVDVAYCTSLDGDLFVTASANLSTGIPCTVLNCLVLSPNGTCLNANTLGQITENYCYLVGGTPRTNVTAGANSQVGPDYAPLLELGQAQMWGFSPRPYGSPMAGAPFLGFGNGVAQSVDHLNRPRPSGGSITNAVGALGRHDTATKETSVTDAGGVGLKMTGPGDHDLLIPVTNASTTISVKVRYDTNHGTTNKPQITLVANPEIGVVTETKTATVGVDTWETLTFTAFTPTAKSFAKVRLISRAAAANGIAYFDTSSVPNLETAGMDYFGLGEPFPALTQNASGGGVTKLAGFGGGLAA